VFDVFKKYLAQVENETGLKLNFLKSDNGSKQYDNIFEKFCVNQGIKRMKTVPGNPHQNGVNERMIITNSGARQEHADTCKIAHAVLSKCSQHVGISDQ